MGQKPETSAVPPKLTKIVRSATCHHTSFLGNGGKARRCLLNCPVRPALHGPFHRYPPATLSLPAARCGERTSVYLLRVIGFGFELGASIRPNIIACQAGKCTFSAFHKRGTPHGGFISYLNTKRRKALENSGITHTLHSQNGGIY